MREIPLGQLAETLGAELDEFCRAVKIATFSGVVRDTRVDTGRLRGSWQLTTSAPAEGVSERLDVTGAAVISEIQQGVRGDTVDYLTNNLIYAPIWDERDGIIDKNVARIERNIREAARR
jgi:hypothetical protein